MTQVAIVLGAALRKDGTPTAALERRAGEAVRLWKLGKVDLIIASGGVPKGGHSEADAIRSICLSSGIPDQIILREERSTSTFENFQFSRAMLPDRTEIMLITDRYHTFRAGLIAREFGLSVTMSSPHAALSMRRRALCYLREAASLALYGLRRVRRVISGWTP